MRQVKYVIGLFFLIFFLQISLVSAGEWGVFVVKGNDLKEFILNTQEVLVFEKPGLYIARQESVKESLFIRKRFRTVVLYESVFEGEDQFFLFKKKILGVVVVVQRNYKSPEYHRIRPNEEVEIEVADPEKTLKLKLLKVTKKGEATFKVTKAKEETVKLTKK